MSRPLHRGTSTAASDLPDRTHSENGGCRFDPSSPAPSLKPFRLSFPLLFFFKAALLLALGFALSGSLYWAASISGASRASSHIAHRRLQQQLATDLAQIGKLARAAARLKELDFCPPEYEDYVPCYYNVSESSGSGDPEKTIEFERRCVRAGEGCLVAPPREYRIPLRWPSGRDFIWKENVKITGHEFSSGSLTKRMMVEEEQISFRSDSLMVDGVEDYSHQIAEMIGLRNESNFNEAGVRTVLDIGCGFGSFGAHLFSRQLLTMCIANYEASGSQVQITLERGLPAIIGSFASKQLPYPYLSFDMVHCARCGMEWEKNDGIFLLEVDRLLKPGGYFIWTESMKSTQRSLHNRINQTKWAFIRDFAQSLCWDMLSQQDETVVWKKSSKLTCYSSRKSGPSVCGQNHDLECPYNRPLNPCISGTRSQRWIPIEDRTPWPSQAKLNISELNLYGVHSEDFSEDGLNWASVVQNYWSLLSPLIFSDHPKRPGDEDPSPPFNILRNVLDMNAPFGGFNAALLDAGKSVWVMNVAPTSGPNYLPLILDRGFVGVQHDWCEAFPTYPRTYDMVHAEGLLMLESRQQYRCSTLDIFLEIDRILRPEGWVILRDTAPLIEAARSVTTQLRWDARMMELESNRDEKLLICQKPFFKTQQ